MTADVRLSVLFAVTLLVLERVGSVWKRDPYTIETLQPTMLGYIPVTILEATIAQSLPWRHYVFHRIAAELSLAQEQMLALGRMTAQEKIARFLVILSQRAVENYTSPYSFVFLWPAWILPIISALPSRQSAEP